MVFSTLRRPDLDEGLPGSETDTTRLWVSDQQWLSILERLKRGVDDDCSPADPGGASLATGARRHARRATAFRCLLRLAAPDNRKADHGTYLVRSRNLSSGGLAFAHHTALHAGTRCTVGLQAPDGTGMILSARVAWCRLIDRRAEDSMTYHVGVQFDQPVSLDPRLTAA